jgi:hypothetical protein
MGPLVVAAPQSPQKRAPEGFWLPQVAHRQGSGDPQSPQNFLPLVFEPQRGQIIGAPSFRRRSRAGMRAAQRCNTRWGHW